MGEVDEIEEKRLNAVFARRARWQADLDDYGREASGLDVGRIARFFPDFAGGGVQAQTKKVEDARAMSRLQMLLASNAAYARAYAGVMDQLDRADDLAYRALDQALQAVDQAELVLADIQDRAVTDTEWSSPTEVVHRYV